MTQSEATTNTLYSSKLKDTMDSTFSNLLQAEPKTTELILVRHGQTEWNLNHRMQGQGDSNLTDAGKYGASKVGQKLYQLHCSDRPIDFVYCSPLGRARETARLIMEQFKNSSDDRLDVVYDDRLMERHFGDWQGLTKQEILEHYKELHSDINYKPPGKNSESKHMVQQRAIEFCSEIAAKHHGKRVLVVTHGGVLESIFIDILMHNAFAERTFFCKNCAINIIQRDPANGKWYLSVLGDDEYGDYQTMKRNSNKQASLCAYPMHGGSLLIGVCIGSFLAYYYSVWKNHKE